MKNGGDGKRKLIAELASAHQKVCTIESQLKEHGQTKGKETEHCQTMSDLRDSEMRYRRLFETAKDGILILDANSGAITDANPFIKKILGYSRQELIGKRLWEIGAFFDVVASKAAFEELQRKEYIRYENLPLQTKDGQMRQVEFISNVYLVDLKKVIQCNIRNITKHKETELALKESEIRYRRLFETAQDGILILDADTGKIIDVNPFLLKLLGFIKEEFLGKRLWEIGAFIDTSDSKIAFEELQLKKYIRYEDLPLKTKDGRLIAVEFVSNVYLVGHQKVIQCNIRDITDRKHAEQEIVAQSRFPSENPNPVIQVEKDGKIKYANHASETLLRIWNCMVGECLPIDWQEKVANAMNDNTNVTIDVQYNDLCYSIMIVPILNSGYVNLYGRDITDRKRAEEALVKERNLLHTLIDTLPDRIFAKDIDSKFILNNAAHLRALGVHSQKDALGKTDYDFRPQEYADRYFISDKQVLQTGEALINFEEQSITASGEIGWMLSTKVPLRDTQGNIIGLVGNGRDITERKKLQQELFQSQKLQSVGVLAGGIAHDFNNILGIILGYTSLIEKDKLHAQKQSENIAAINQAVQRGAALVRQILTFARKTDVLFEPMSLANLFQEIFSMLEQTFPKIITFKKIFPEDIPLILADRTQIHQVLLNLCVNARDAMPNGGSITIEVKQQTGKQLKEQFPTADQNMYVCVSVTDTGGGMNESTRRKVFDPFFTTKDKGKGTGLGLSVVYGVMQAHQGFVNVESELGHGTTFHLYFPIPDISQTPTVSRKDDTYELGGTETILVVEDEEFLLNAMRFLLESKGYNVLSAQDGVEAIEMYKKHIQEIALVLTDIGLPLMTGIEEFKKLQEIDPSAAVIFASGYFEPEIKAELLNAGAKGFLQKPYMPDEIFRTLREALDKKASKDN
jgi:PAS domain S-box-containing protein